MLTKKNTNTKNFWFDLNFEYCIVLSDSNPIVFLLSVKKEKRTGDVYVKGEKR